MGRILLQLPATFRVGPIRYASGLIGMVAALGLALAFMTPVLGDDSAVKEHGAANGQPAVPDGKPAAPESGGQTDANAPGASEKAPPAAPDEPEGQPGVPGAASEANGTTPSQDAAQPVGVRRAQMRLSGSTCLACLTELERRLKGVHGVRKVKVVPPGESVYHQSVPGMPWSEATIVYDAGQMPLKDLIGILKRLGYHAYKVVDKAAE